MRRVLYISYWFPPAGGSGVRRPAKIARYLPAAGWEPIVLTVPEDEYRLVDRSYPEAGELAEVHRVPAGPFPLAHDRGLAWLRPMLRAARRLVQRLGIEVVLYSGDPFRPAVALPRLGVPFVLDLRDPWAWDDRYRPRDFRGRRARLVDTVLERVTLPKAFAVTTVGEPIAARYRQAYPSLRIASLPGGYDPADFVVRRERARTFTVSYVGGLNPSVGLTAELLLRTGARLRARRPDAAFRVEIVGDPLPEDRALADALGLGDVVTFAGRVSHADAVAAVQRAHVLWLETCFTEPWVVTGKVFEYLAAERPIIVVGEGQAMHAIARSGGLAHEVPRDPERIAAALEHLHDAGADAVAPNRAAIAAYAYPRLAEGTAELLDRAVKGK